jgi:hypothetical protein
MAKGTMVRKPKGKMIAKPKGKMVKKMGTMKKKC